MMKKYTVSVLIDTFANVTIKAESLEHALELAKDISPNNVLKAQKNTELIDWEVKKIVGVLED